jgi:hypothetical protein
MKVYLSPISMQGSLSVEVAGNSITINGNTYSLPELVAMLEAEQPLPDPIVTATADSVTLLLPYWGEASDAVRFPEPIIDPPDGPLVLPS